MCHRNGELSLDGEQELAGGLARGSSWSRSGQGGCTGQGRARSAPVVCWAVGDEVDMAGPGSAERKGPMFCAEKGGNVLAAVALPRAV